MNLQLNWKKTLNFYSALNICISDQFGNRPLVSHVSYYWLGKLPLSITLYITSSSQRYT